MFSLKKGLLTYTSLTGVTRPIINGGIEHYGRRCSVSVSHLQRCGNTEVGLT